MKIVVMIFNTNFSTGKKKQLLHFILFQIMAFLLYFVLEQITAYSDGHVKIFELLDLVDLDKWQLQV
jgi:hypothetical protein